MPQKKDLSQAPSESAEKATGNHESKAQRFEVCFTGDHHDNTNRHGCDDKNELVGGSLESEEKGEDEDKGQGRGFAHGKEGQGYVAKGGVAKADVERCGSAAWQKSSEPEKGCDDCFELSRIEVVWLKRAQREACVWLRARRWTERWDEEEDESREAELDEHMKGSRE